MRGRVAPERLEHICTLLNRVVRIGPQSLRALVAVTPEIDHVEPERGAIVLRDGSQLSWDPVEGLWQAQA